MTVRDSVGQGLGDSEAQPRHRDRNGPGPATLAAQPEPASAQGRRAGHPWAVGGTAACFVDSSDSIRDRDRRRQCAAR